MSYLTDKEQLQRFEYYTLEFENRLLEGEDFITVGDKIPFAVHLNNPTTLEVMHTNHKHQELIGHHIDEVREMGMAFLDKYIHAESMEMVSKVLPPLYAEVNRHKTFTFIQYVKLKKQDDYTPVFTFTKPSRLANGKVVCLSLLPDDFGSHAPKMEQIVRMDHFKLKNFNKFKQLTGREIEILTLLAEGKNNPEIAGRLFLSRETVETHRKHINKKLDIHSCRDLIKYAIAFDLVSF